MKQRVIFYVDGFNFYYGLRTKKNIDHSWRAAYWIDLLKFFNQFLSPNQTLEKVVYFTASPLNPDKSNRQGAFLNANKLLNKSKFEIVRGQYMKKAIQCPKCKYTIIRPEEKKTDVNIAIRMIGDCIDNNADILVLVSGDSDLLPPIEFIQRKYPDKKIRVYFPPTIFSIDLKNNIKAQGGKIVMLENNKNKFLVSRMSDVVTNGEKSYFIPDKWKL
ncbi:MAG: NYN domain-containing protein [Prevotellaceae bacterium]|jgi:uncharacterized LabA/DUF88 family protein|nr:NYN domain-containing protein [Prevotellaceae bacterium]